VIKKFGDWWFAPEQAQLRSDAIVELNDKLLGCYCAPKPCHGDIIAAYVNYHARHPSPSPLQ
jgi:hypothetical protein